MDITTCVDVIIGVCMLVSVLVGYHRGFLVTIARIVAMVAAYIGAVLAAGTLKKMLAEAVFVPVLEHCLLHRVFCGVCGVTVCTAA